MIVTDYNKMTLEELMIFNKVTGTEFEISDGKIIGVHKED